MAIVYFARNFVGAKIAAFDTNRIELDITKTIFDTDTSVLDTKNAAFDMLHMDMICLGNACSRLILFRQCLHQAYTFIDNAFSRLVLYTSVFFVGYLLVQALSAHSLALLLF